jgi:uncharacterized Zn finger protein (UPF0148 family)
MIRCDDCGRRYDYDEDAFCPNCGAFNQPPKSVLINEAGEVVRVDGMNEAGHAHSFAHEEFHAEEKERRRSGLDKSVRRVTRGEESIQSDVQRTGEEAKSAARPQQSGRRGNLKGGVLPWIIFAIILFNLLRSCTGLSV